MDSKFTPRQIEIIKAATDLIGEKGIQNVTTKNLAEVMGFSEPALYRHFKGKIDILVSVLEYSRMKMRGSIEDIIDGEGTGLEKINKIISYQFDLFTREPAIIMVIFAETSFQYDKQLSETVRTLLNQKQEMITRLLAAGMQDGSVRNDIPAEQITSIVLGAMRFTVLQWRLANFAFDLNEKGAELCSTINTLITKK